MVCLHRAAVAVFLLVVVACSDGDSPGTDQGAPVGELVGEGCSTAVVAGLSLQIADEIACMMPGVLVSFAGEESVVFSGAEVLPFVSEAGLDDLRAALAAHGGVIQVNSAFRTVVQQYLLYQWFLAARCDIAVAATPGTSNHESGRALDIGNYQDWSTILPDYGWAQTVLPNDPVHFDHLDSPDNRGLDVIAFQRLWNRNRPNDSIDEDGFYGPATEDRILQSPSGGFAVASDCR